MGTTMMISMMIQENSNQRYRHQLPLHLLLQLLHLLHLLRQLFLPKQEQTTLQRQVTHMRPRPDTIDLRLQPRPLQLLQRPHQQQALQVQSKVCLPCLKPYIT